MNTESSSTKSSNNLLVRWLFLRALGVIHLMAFASYAYQIVGLNGNQGILPTRDLLNAMSDLGWQKYFVCPSLAWLNSSDAFLQGMCISGVILSFFVILGIATGPSLLALAVLWLSVSVGGGDFTGFQSDGMLVEISAITLFFVPWQFFEPPWPVPLRLRQQTAPPLVSLWLIRFMLFRIMFVSGVVKIASGDPTWHDFSALQYHYETQPIPTPLAWYAHQMPHWTSKISVLVMFVSELIAPFGMFGNRIARLCCAALIFLLHFGIALTGNYTFLSFLMMTLCITLLDDELLSRLLPASLSKSMEESLDPAHPGRYREAIYKSAVFVFFSAAITMFSSTLFSRQIVPFMRPVLSYFSSLQIANSYGLFAVMTTTRDEIVFEGSNDGKTWKSYEFACKPGDDLKRPPPWVAPHMPRLDWRLWFAAMGPVEQSQWVLSFVKCLLAGSKEVSNFLLVNPFPNNPPKYIRAFVYDYHFTNFAERTATGDWWRRDNKRVYMPAVTLKDGLLELADLASLSEDSPAPQR